jgi:hypothetical protein
MQDNEVGLNFQQLLLQPRPATRARYAGKDALSLSFHKERAKEKEPGRSLRDLPTARRSDDERRGF